jgi:hypothetical protein
MSIKINIVGRFGNSGSDLEGTGASLLELSERVREITGHETFELKIPKVPPFPHSGYLKSLQIDVSEGKVQIWRDENCIYATGSVEMIAILAKNIAFLATQKNDRSSVHSHIEYFPGHFYLTEGSEPLVLTRREAIAQG